MAIGIILGVGRRPMMEGLMKRGSVFNQCSRNTDQQKNYYQQWRQSRPGSCLEWPRLSPALCREEGDLPCPICIQVEVGKVTLKSNGDEALSDEFLLKSNSDEALIDVFL
jgi:hypothetical protein